MIVGSHDDGNGSKEVTDGRTAFVVRTAECETMAFDKSLNRA
jgi:hypothetical protein